MFRVDVRVIRGVCNLVVARKKTMVEKKDALGICSTPGCDGVNNRGRDKCRILACIPRSLNEAEVATRETRRRPIRSIHIYTCIQIA